MLSRKDKKFCSKECWMRHANNCSCSFCGKEFYKIPAVIKGHKDHFCSKECHANFQRGDVLEKECFLKCLNCGKEFRVSPSQIKNGRKFCSRKCFRDTQKKIEKTCEHCGELFYITPWKEKHGSRKFCSMKCYREAHRGDELVCKVCGKIFYSNLHKMHKNRGIYCSVICRLNDMFGEGNPNWCGGSSFGKYCKKFNGNLKIRVRAYFGYKCIVCGKTTEENGRQLDVHHIEYNKSACCDGKSVHFAALCRECHTRTTPKKNREYWETVLHRIIDEIYGSRSYFTKEEWKTICNKSI
jgi:hypothetical protein